MQTSVKLDILSLNVQGIRDQIKRRSIFSFLKDFKANIYFLQETYSDLKDEIIWKNEWGGEIFFSHGTNHSKGVCILINPTIHCQVDYCYSNNSGRVVLITITFGSQKLSLCNIYAPNNQTNQLEFMQELNNCIIDKTELTTLIVGGDWNCTLSKKDKIGGTTWIPTSYRNLLMTTMDMFDLIDIQRVRHPKLRKFTYESKAIRMKSRIDYFLLAKNLTKNVKKTDVFPSIAPDHNAIYISMSLSCESPRGPGLWKFNNTLLNDEEYVERVRETYLNTVKYYRQVTSKGLLWELIKMEIRNATISYTKYKAKVSRDRAEEIRHLLEQLDNTICNKFFSPDINQLLLQYDNLKSELQSLYENKGKQGMFRAKCRWVEQGERPTKYFFNLEKRNYNKKTIRELRLEDKSTTINDKQILDQIEAYFRDLYTSVNTAFSQDEYDEFTQHLQIPKLSDEDRDNLEGPLSYEECKTVLESFQNDKSPGEDGFTVEFYKLFYDLLSENLLACLNEAYEKNELTISQRRGIITLLPKEDGSLLDLHNWRPITLLNVDLKIAAKAIAKRLETVLPNLIHPDQTGFVKGRYIGENIRLISDVLDFTKEQKIPGILVALDFRKAFDSLEWPFIMRILDAFNFGSSIKRWISTFYTNVESAVLNGCLTNWFKPSKGVRQGCPLSPYLFILSAELMSIKISFDPGVKGINLFGNEFKLSQFADDTNLFCADLISIERALNIVNDFGRIAGLQLNMKKTKAIWLGKWANNKTNPLDMKWMHTPVKILGVHFSYDKKGNDDLNFSLKLRKLQTKLDMWSARSLTLFGRVLITKTLGISQIIYSASNIQVPDSIADTLKKKLFNFIWKKKKDKIKRTVLYQDLENGGLRMTDVDLMFKALRLAWIPRLLNAGDKNWCSVPNYYFRKQGGLNFLLKCNYDTKYFPQLPAFYKNILRFFHELKILYGYDQASDLVLYNNKEILIDQKTVYLSKWMEKGIVFIKDLLKEDGSYLSFEEFKGKFSCKTNFIQYFQIISAIPDRLRLKARQIESVNKQFFTSNDHFFHFNRNFTFNLDKAKSRDFYNLFIDKTHNGGQTGPKRWSETLSLNGEHWAKIFKTTQKLCKETKLKEFQFKFIHRIVVTKRELFKYGIKTDDECCFCGERDSIDHTFIHCSFTKSFIQKVICWFNTTYNSHISPTMEELLFGITSNLNEKSITNKFNYITLFMRYYIHSCKLNNKPIDLHDFVNAVQQRDIIENTVNN